MNLSQVSPLKMFSQPLQYLVPIFQRGYVWSIDKKQITTLWSDIADRAEQVVRYQELLDQAKRSGSAHMVSKPRRHFLGTVIVTEHQSGESGAPYTSEVIDGQQRLTTTQLLALAFRHAVAGADDAFERRRLDVYTHNGEAYRLRHHSYKLWPTNAGHKEMESIAGANGFEHVCEQHPLRTIGKGKAKKVIQRPLMVEAYLYFYGVISIFLRGKDPGEPLDGADDDAFAELSDLIGVEVEDTWATRWTRSIRTESAPKPPFADLPIQANRIQLLLTTLLEYFQLVELKLGPEDDAQIIFQSLNGLGESLTPADLVRNFVFMEAARSGADTIGLYANHWKDFDEAPPEKDAPSKSTLFWKVDERQGRLTNTRLDTLLYHYVSMRSMDEVKLDHVFDSFKMWWGNGARDVDAELRRLKDAANVFRALVVPDRTTRFGRFAHNMRVLDTSTLNPVVLFLAERHGVESAEFLDCLGVLESYVVRRAVCKLSPAAYNRIFPAVLKSLANTKTSSATTIRRHLSSLAGATQKWPDDAEFSEAWMKLSTYKTLKAARTKMVLESLELGLRNKFHHETDQLATVPLHVEHTLPIGWREHWPSPGDENAQLVRDQLLHNIGNLTLLTESLNPSLSNAGFAAKRPEVTKSLLALNSYFQEPRWTTPGAVWDEAAIRERADALFQVARRIWPLPAAEQPVASGM
jgi:hypothetical protein